MCGVYIFGNMFAFILALFVEFPVNVVAKTLLKYWDADNKKKGNNYPMNSTSNIIIVD